MNVICQSIVQEKMESVQWISIKRMEIHVEETLVTASMVSALQSIFSVKQSGDMVSYWLNLPCVMCLVCELVDESCTRWQQSDRRCYMK
jgi:hypothetical protein